MEQLAPGDLVKGMVVRASGPRWPFPILLGRISDIRRPAWAKANIVTFSYEQPHSDGKVFVDAYVDLSDPRYRFFRVPSPVQKKDLEELGLTYLPGVGPKYFEAEESFQAKQRSGRRRKTQRKRRLPKTKPIK